MRHPVSTSHLVTGLVFLGIAATWWLRQAGVVDPDSSQWLLPLVLVTAGVVGLVAAVGREVSRSGRDGEAPGPPENW